MLSFIALGFLFAIILSGGVFALEKRLAYKKTRLWLASEVAKMLSQNEALLLGPGGGPEGGETVIQRLRQLGFTVLEKRVQPRSHMLGWLFTSVENYVCFICKEKFLLLNEICEIEDHSVTEAFLVGPAQIGRFCNSCGLFERIQKVAGSEIKIDGFGKLKNGFFWPVLNKAHACNLFDILDHLQASGKMDEEFCKWLEERRQLLCREAEKISSAISRHQLSTSKDISDDPYRSRLLPDKV